MLLPSSIISYSCSPDSLKNTITCQACESQCDTATATQPEPALHIHFACIKFVHTHQNCALGHSAMRSKANSDGRPLCRLLHTRHWVRIWVAWHVRVRPPCHDPRRCSQRTGTGKTPPGLYSNPIGIVYRPPDVACGNASSTCGKLERMGSVAQCGTSYLSSALVAQWPPALGVYRYDTF